MIKKVSFGHKVINIMLIISMIFGCVDIPVSFAQTEISDYVLEDAAVSLNGEDDGEVEVKFVSKSGGTFGAFQGTWSTSESEDSNYISLASFSPASNMNEAFIQSNDVTTGEVIYAELSATSTGANVQAQESIWSAKYKVDKDTPAGTYTVALNVSAVDNYNDTYDIDGSENFSATITVTRVEPITPLVATFSGDSGVDSIDVYYKNTYTSEPSEQAVESTCIRNGDTGEIDVSGNGQVNFTVNLKSNYKITSVTASDGTYTGTIKGPGDTGKANTYQITKVNSNTTITIATSQITEYVGNFTLGEGIDSIDLFYTNTYVTPSETNVTSAYARAAETGETTLNGLGQISFKVNPKDGYYVDESDITVTGNYKSIVKPSELGYTNVYCITKVAGDITINVPSRAKLSIIPQIDGYNDSYEYTGNHIEPNITVKSEEYETTLVEGNDYEITYGENKNVVSGGTIKVSPVITSKYQFTERTVNFNITPKQINDSNVTVPSSITYRDGNELTPEVAVTVDGKTLALNQEYTVQFSGQTSNVGQYVTVTVTGNENYSGTVTKNVLIVDKPTQTISFEDEVVNKQYGDASFTKSITRSVGDGTITYSSTNTSVATVNQTTGAITIVGAGQTTIVATAAATVNYAESTASYMLNVSKKSISIKNATISNKEYDGTTDATISNISFEGLPGGVTFVNGTDYTVVAKFADANIGTNKAVTVELTLKGNALNNYALSTEVYTAKANITGIEIKSNHITLNENTYTYDGNSKEPAVSVVVNGNTLTKDTDYTITFRNNKNSGTAYVDVEGIGNYKGNASVPFTINKLVATPTVDDIADVVYNGEAQEPQVIIKVNEQVLVNQTDYSVEYSNNINVGEANAQISAAYGGNYEFTAIQKKFQINPYELKDSDVTLSYTTVRWNGQERKPGVTVKVNNKIVDEANYELSYENNIDLGEATVTITAKEHTNITGTILKHFTISEKEVLTISGISNNQSIQYTGRPVVLNGAISVSENSNGIKASDVTVKYYDSNNNEINRPTELGNYSATYSYSDEDYNGSLSVNFEITKAKSDTPAEATNVIKAIKNQTLADVALSTVGLSWQNNNEEVLEGKNIYNATYTKNGDTEHYTTETIPITVYGRKYINIETSVNGMGGTITPSMSNILEGTTQSIKFMPDEGYEIDTVVVNGKNVPVDDNELLVTVGATNVNIVVTYKNIKYKITITATNMDDLQSEMISVDYKSSTELRLKAKYGYKLTSVKVNGNEMISKLQGDVLTLESITSDINIIATAEKILEDSKNQNNTDTIQNDKSSNDSTANNNKKQASSKNAKTGDNIKTYFILGGIAVAILALRKKIIVRKSNNGKANKR